MKPLFDEMVRQIDREEFKGARLASATQKLLTVPGFKQDFAPAFTKLLDHWPESGTITNVTSSGGVGRAWERQMEERLRQKVSEDHLSKMNALKKRVEEVSESKESRFAMAFDTLRLTPCTAWLEYLQSTGSIAYSGTLQHNKSAFKAALAQATSLIDALLESRIIYDDTAPVTEDYSSAMSSGSTESMIWVVLEHYGLTDWGQPAHWFAKGMILAQHPEIPIRCDGAAALAFYTLCTSGSHGMSIALVQQGEDPRSEGHWFLLAGVATDLSSSNINPFGTEPSKRKISWCFVIDLWGASFRGLKTTVFYPAECIAGRWKPKVLWVV